MNLKSILAMGAVVVLGQQASATGGLDCATAGNKVEFWTTEAREEAPALLGMGVVLNEKSLEFDSYASSVIAGRTVYMGSNSNGDIVSVEVRKAGSKTLATATLKQGQKITRVKNLICE